MVVRVAVIWKPDGAGRYTSKMVGSHVWQLGAGCWQEASVPHIIDLHSWLSVFMAC
jgi:hypothetical protein